MACLVTVLTVAAAPAAAQQSPREQAIALAMEAEQLYEAERFGEAIDRLREAIALEPDARLYYNLGRAHERRAAGKNRSDLAAALAAYRECHARSADAPVRADVEERMAVIQQLLRSLEPAAPSPRPTAAPPPLSAPPTRPSAVPWVIAGAGVAGVIAGVVFGVRASALEGDLEDEARGDNRGTEIDRLNGAASTHATAANIAFVTGSSIALLGLVWGIVDVTTSDDAPAAARPRHAAVLRW